MEKPLADAPLAVVLDELVAIDTGCLKQRATLVGHEETQVRDDTGLGASVVGDHEVGGDVPTLVGLVALVGR